MFAITRRRRLIAGAVLVVCGAVGFAVLRRPSGELVLALQSYGTNEFGEIEAAVVVRNTGPRNLFFYFGTSPPMRDHDGSHTGFIRSYEQAVINVSLPSVRPCKVIASVDVQTHYSSRKVWRWLDREVFKRAGSDYDYYTLKIPD